ncbi:MAG: uracil-DNA glycosylase [Actinomycetales bacterium]|nr:uracil-DNA glycosylase [Actinomycetales bacterium]
MDAGIVECRACARLVAWREEVARERRAAYRDQDYWGRPVTGFGDPRARVLIVGLAPAAHGANRTGRVFTGDRSGDWLFASLHRVGVAALPTSTSVDDGQRLEGVRITAAVRCAPPANAPTPHERDTCAPWLLREVQLTDPRVVVALGGFAWASALRALADADGPIPTPRPRFGHGVQTRVGPRWLVGCYHPSQQNTFTGRLTEPMIDAVLAQAIALGDSVPPEGIEPSLDRV